MESSSAPNICANCGKGEEESDNLKKCSACLSVKYCSRECQAAHRPQHKRECKKRAVELHEEALFKEVELEDCPICMLPLSFDTGTATFESCCGKRICSGCIYAMYESDGTDLCAFCRTPGATSEEEEMKRLKKLMDKGNARAFHQLAGAYAQGIYGMPQDRQRANELYLKAGELGCTSAYYNLGNSYLEGNGVDVDTKKAIHFYELAAMGGNVIARHNVGCLEMKADNYIRAMKHFILAARAGYKDALDRVKGGFMTGFVTKDEYANTLRAHQKAQDDMRSDMRDKFDTLKESNSAWSR